MTLAEKKSKGVKERKKTPYDLWVAAEGVPVIREYAVQDLMSVPVSNWERKGVPGTFIKRHGSEHLTDAYLLELPPRASTKTQKHLFEELIYMCSAGAVAAVAGAPLSVVTGGLATVGIVAAFAWRLLRLRGYCD